MQGAYWTSTILGHSGNWRHYYLRLQSILPTECLPYELDQKKKYRKTFPSMRMFLLSEPKEFSKSNQKMQTDVLNNDVLCLAGLFSALR